MYDRKKFGDRIRQLRIQNEYTQKELAEKAGMETGKQPQKAKLAAEV